MMPTTPTGLWCSIVRVSSGIAPRRRTGRSRPCACTANTRTPRAASSTSSKALNRAFPVSAWIVSRMRSRLSRISRASFVRIRERSATGLRAQSACACRARAAAPGTASGPVGASTP